MDELKKLTLTELKGAFESVNKAIESEKNFMGIAKDAFIEKGEVCIIYSTKLIKLQNLPNEKTGKPLYNEKQIERVRKYIDDMKILYKRQNNIVLEIKRREWGDDFFRQINNKYTLEEIEIVSLNDKANELKNSKERATIIAEIVGKFVPDGLVKMTMEDEEAVLEREKKLNFNKNYIFFENYNEIEEQLEKLGDKNEILNYLIWLNREANNILIDLKGIDFIQFENAIICNTNNPNINEQLKYINKFKKHLITDKDNIIKELINLMSRYGEDIKNKLLPKINNGIEYFRNVFEANKRDEREKREKKKIRLNNEIIADAVVNLWDEGMEEFEEIYKKISDNSEELFGVRLTKGQIKGRYQRFSAKNKDYKREKY